MFQCDNQLNLVPDEIYESPFVWCTPAQKYSKHSMRTGRASSAEFLEHSFAKLDANIERQVMQRCVPSYKKEITGHSRMVVGTLEDEEWAEYRRRKMLSFPGRSSTRRIAIPTPQFTAEDEVETLQWRGAHLPSLHHQPTWGRLKWIMQGTTVLVRAEVNDFALVRNAWTHVVRVQFTYTTEIYDWAIRNWREI